MDEKIEELLQKQKIIEEAYIYNHAVCKIFIYFETDELTDEHKDYLKSFQTLTEKDKVYTQIVVKCSTPIVNTTLLNDFYCSNVEYNNWDDACLYSKAIRIKLKDISIDPNDIIQDIGKNEVYIETPNYILDCKQFLS